VSGVELTEDETRAFRDVANRMIEETRGSDLVTSTHIGLLRIALDPWNGEERLVELRIAAAPKDFRSTGEGC
jgi:hypothetical protein